MENKISKLVAFVMSKSGLGMNITPVFNGEYYSLTVYDSHKGCIGVGGSVYIQPNGVEMDHSFGIDKLISLINER